MTPEEELEYRRYLRWRIRKRKRRRQVMIARTIVALAGLLLIFFIFYGIGHLTGSVTDGESGGRTTQQEIPTETPFIVNIPEGYEELYEKIYGMRDDYPEVDDILMNLGNYPKDLLELLAKNAETVKFVSDYPMHMDDDEANGGITKEELLQEDPPLLQQWDQRWGYVTYGSNIIAINGCGPTCMSMVYAGLTKDTSKNPAVIADFCMENDYYTEDSGTSWALMSDGAENLGLEVEALSIGQETIQSKLESGCLVICSMKPGDFTDIGHFIVLRGVTKQGKLLINDPNSIARSQKKWGFGVVLKQIKAAWAYSYTG